MDQEGVVDRGLDRRREVWQGGSEAGANDGQRMNYRMGNRCDRYQRQKTGEKIRSKKRIIKETISLYKNKGIKTSGREGDQG